MSRPQEHVCTESAVLNELIIYYVYMHVYISLTFTIKEIVNGS